MFFKLISYKISKDEDLLNTLKLYPLFFDRKKALFYNLSSDFLIKLAFVLPLLSILIVSNVVFYHKLILIFILISDFIVSFIYADIATPNNNKYINFAFKIGVMVFAVSTSFPFGVPSTGVSESKLSALLDTFLFGTLAVNLIFMFVGIVLFKKRKDMYVF